LSIHLYNTKTEFGALTLYSDQSLTFTPQFEELALALGAHAAIGLSCVRRDAQFESALASRDMIGQAKGMIMERYNLDAVAAFALMVTLSQESNTPVTEISRQLVESEHPSP
jgi:ANTAR domain